MIQQVREEAVENAERNGIRSGSRIRRVAVTGSSPASRSRFSTSCGVTQFRIGVRGFSRSHSSTRSTGRQSWLYEWIDDPCLAVGVAPRRCAKSPSRSSTYGSEVGEDDVVERLVELDVLAAPDLEAKLRMARPRELDLAGADVDSDALGAARARRAGRRRRSRSRARTRPAGRSPGGAP